MKLNIIVAHDKNNVIGNSSTNSMPWHLPPDLKRFKELTMGHPIIMGRHTFESLPFKNGLPGRTNIVISHNLHELSIPYNQFDNLIQTQLLGFSDLTKALIFCETWMKAEQAFIIGGGKLYHHVLEGIHKIDCIYRTVINDQFDGDVKFPDLTEKKVGIWQSACTSPLFEYNGLEYYYETLANKGISR